MPNTLIPIQTVTVGAGGASAITFTNIPQNYTDLCIKYSVRFSNASIYANTVLRFNGSTSNYTMIRLYGDGSSASTYSNTDIFDVAPGAQATASSFNNAEFYITNYSSSNSKSVYGDAAMETNSTTAQLLLTAGKWADSSPITSISLGNTGYNLAQFSSATLYGVSNGVKAVGGTLTVAGGYAYHTFTSTGSFLPSQQIKGAEVLVVAGGGGGDDGGGGAGGVLYANSQTFLAGLSYTALVGAGGSGNATGSDVSTRGANSVFGSFIAFGGGRGRLYNTGNGVSGGSGGGAPRPASGTNTGGSATQTSGTNFVGYGNTGGNSNSANNGAGGGGGAGSVGLNGFGTFPNGGGGNGGIGLSAYTTWHSTTGTGVLSGGVYYIAAGGGGFGHPTAGSGGVGGGGNGSNNSGNATAGTANTGSGGGAAAGGGTSVGTGGSGLIIVRYPLT